MESSQKTTIEFEQKFFTAVEGSYFRKSEHTSEPVFVINLGSEEVIPPLRGIRREFKIEEETPDDEMLELVSNGLDYLKALMPGDVLPPELLTGEASWEIRDTHRQVAKQRISMQLVSWMFSEENLISDPEQLIQIADDPGVKEKINKAFNQAAEEIDADDANLVVDLIEELAEELAYIETLREQFRGVLQMRKRSGRCARLLRSNAASSTRRPRSATPGHRGGGVRRRIRHGGWPDRRDHLGVENIGTQKDYIRSVRNSVYRRLFAWDELLCGWEREPGRMTETVPDLLRKTYQFLAPRYMQTDDWLLASQVQGNQEGLKEQVW